MSTSRSAARRFERTDLAAAEVAVSRADLKKTENQVAVHVHRLYFAVLIAELQKRAAAERVAYAACSGYFTEMRRRAKAATPSNPRAARDVFHQFPVLRAVGSAYPADLSRSPKHGR